jgi:hypothetical protein
MAASDCLLATNKMVVVFHVPLPNRRNSRHVTFLLLSYAAMNQDLKVRRFADVAEVQTESLVAINSISF